MVTVERDRWAISKKGSEAGAGRFLASGRRYEDYLGDGRKLATPEW
jgi:hypothetical protein